MCDYDNNRGVCEDCGGEDGYHYSGCDYEGTGMTSGGYSHRRSSGSNVSTGKWWLLYIIALILGYGINELLGAVIIIGLIFGLCVN